MHMARKPLNVRHKSPCGGVSSFGAKKTAGQPQGLTGLLESLIVRGSILGLPDSIVAWRSRQIVPPKQRRTLAVKPGFSLQSSQCLTFVFWALLENNAIVGCARLIIRAIAPVQAVNEITSDRHGRVTQGTHVGVRLV